MLHTLLCKSLLNTWHVGQTWWHTPVIQELRRPRQEDYKFQASLGYTMSLSPFKSTHTHTNNVSRHDGAWINSSAWVRGWQISGVKRQPGCLHSESQASQHYTVSLWVFLSLKTQKQPNQKKNISKYGILWCKALNYLQATRLIDLK